MEPVTPDSIRLGSGEAGRTIPVRAGCVYRLAPDVRQRQGPARGTTWQEHWISFEGPAADALMHDLDDGDRSVVLSRSGAAGLDPFHHAIRLALSGPEPAATRQAGLAVHRLLLAVAALRDGGDDVTSAAQDEMAAAALSGAFDCRAFCRRHGLAPHRFRRHFVRRFGQAPLRHYPKRSIPHREPELPEVKTRICAGRCMSMYHAKHFPSGHSGALCDRYRRV